jgi:short-subunit dehydrogenase
MRIVITGAADGLGREITNQFKDNDLILIDYNEVKLKEIAKKMSANSYICDLSSAEEIKVACDDIKKRFKEIDVLINCAGVWLDESKETDLEKYKNMILVNLFGPIAMIQGLLPIFVKQKNGLIININSQSGVERERATGAVYGATKAGLVAYRQNLKKELGKNGIRMTDICPGLIGTGLFEKAGVEISDNVFNKY